MRKGLEIALSGLIGVGCLGCSGRDYQPQPNQRERYYLEDRCTNPKVIVRDNDPRFFSLRSHYFNLFGYKDGEIDFDDERWIYYPGEEFVLAIGVPQNLQGSRLNLALMNSKKQVLAKKNEIAGEACFKRFSADDFIRRYGEGDFSFGVGYDGKLAGILYFRIED